MIAKCEHLRRTLLEIDSLLQTMHAAGVDNDPEHDDIDFLQHSRRSIIALLEARRKLNLHNIVSLKDWRDGRAMMSQFTAEDYATMVRPRQPRCGMLRPHLVS